MDALEISDRVHRFVTDTFEHAIRETLRNLRAGYSLTGPTVDCADGMARSLLIVLGRDKDTD